MNITRILRYAILTILSALFLCCGIPSLTANASSNYVVIAGRTITPDGKTYDLFGGQVRYSYQDGSGTLELSNVTINSTQPHAIEIDAPSEIILTGNNTINHTYHRSESDPGAAIYTDYRCKIAGNGSLTINADDDAAIYVNDSLTIEGTTLTIHANSRSATCGIYACNDLTIDFATVTVDGNARYGTYDRGTMTIKGRSVVRAEGRTYGIYQGAALGDHSNETLLIEDSTVIARGGTYGIMSHYQKVTGFFYDYDGSNIRVSGLSDVYAYGGINCPKRPDQNTLMLSPSASSSMRLEAGSDPTNVNLLMRGVEDTFRMKAYIDDLGGVLNQFNYVHIYDIKAMEHVEYNVVFNLGADVEQPRSITLQLRRGDTIVAQKDASAVLDWKSGFWFGRNSRLPDEYRITATVPEGYSYTAEETTRNNWTITVTGGKAVTIDANVDISFDLIDGAVEPENVQLILDEGETQRAPRIVRAEDGWHYTFSNVIKKAAERGVYSLIASVPDQSYHVDVYGDPLKGYKVVVCGGKVAPTPEPEPEAYDIDLKATFNITEGADYPDLVRVNLVKDGETLKTVELVETLDWKGAFRDLLLDSKEDYQIVVESIEGYTIDGAWNDERTAYTISVSGGTPVTVDATVITDWDLASPYARPDSITLTLYKGDVVAGTVTLPQDGDNWQATFTDLLKNLADDYRLEVTGYDTDKWHVEVDGDPIRGYRLTVSGGDENLTHVDVETGWALDEGAEKPNITIYLMQNGKIVRTEVLEEDNDWSVSFTNVPKAEIDSYDVVVASIPDGYRYSINGNAKDGYLIAVTGGGSPAPTPTTERHEAVSYSDGECRHDYQWETYKEATATEDGEMRYRCKYCGDVQYSVPVTAYYTFNKETQEKVLRAEQGATVKVQTPWFISFHEMVYKALQERPDVTLVVDYKNEDALYEMTIPAGNGDQLQSLFGDSQFAGFLYLGGTYATTELPSDTVFDGLTATEMWFGTTTAH